MKSKVDTHRKIKMAVSMEVTIPQALALTEMFKLWTQLGSQGSSRDVSFFVDGDGNFQPKCEIITSIPLPEISDAVKKSAKSYMKMEDGSHMTQRL
jgi:hypothetical protein